MGSEGLRKIREGLPLLIEGLIEDTEELLGESPLEHRIVREVLKYRAKQIENHLTEAEEYFVDKEKIKELRRKYRGLKVTVENLK